MSLARPPKRAHINKLDVVEDAALTCINCALDKKAVGLLIINTGTISSFADYFIICTGTSDRHTAAIADSVQKGMKDKGILPLGVAGKGANSWILLDYGDVITHIFLEETRRLYDLEGLWGNAPTMRVEDGIYSINKISFITNRDGGGDT